MFILGWTVSDEHGDWFDVLDNFTGYPQARRHKGASEDNLSGLRGGYGRCYGGCKEGGVDI